MNAIMSGEEKSSIRGQWLMFQQLGRLVIGTMLKVRLYAERFAVIRLLYNIIGVWLIYHRRYREWNKEKSDDLAELLKFMQAYHMRIPRYLERTKFYRQKVK